MKVNFSDASREVNSRTGHAIVVVLGHIMYQLVLHESVYLHLEIPYEKEETKI